MSAWDLPITVQVAGRVFAIRSDFRAVLDALAALADPDLTQQEQYIACLQILYPRWKELPDANAALRAAFTFINEAVFLQLLILVVVNLIRLDIIPAVP